MTRVQRLLDERIIRQVTPIFDTRALGYSSMLVAAKVDPENPWRAANVINEHPGVSHNYLRNHEFNIWFTIATEPGSALGLQGTLDVLAREAGAESRRDRAPALRRLRPRGDPRHAGRHAGDPGALRAGRGRVADPAGAAARAPSGNGRAAPAAPRRRDPVPPACRLQRQRHGCLEGPGRARARDGHGDVAVPWHLALLPAPDLRRLAVLGVHDGPRPLEGGVRCDPRFDRRAHRHQRAHNALLLDRVQEDQAALLHR